MKQSDLYDVASRCGCTVMVFSDHPDFFSSWSLSVRKDEKKYMIEHDGRDGWLMFYQENEPNKFKEIDKRISHAMNDNEKLQQCEIWLASI
ncbi:MULTISPECIES: hypothetical protein [unclassified Pseudomonas]|jgi:hypothetical protein|uniref:hypothetical protein n=1 Tax=unclassified Pseudomonas TaxID=196821 RepID=UPI00177BE56A|nr:MULTISPECIES: hypothetical protein [unclassified Pseudomonas]MBD9599506.1 hypothetical protein [Pseudomonas sp. PDM10]MBV7515257.1 hypothetical protein [Pseudomonas sp. PDM25]